MFESLRDELPNVITEQQIDLLLEEGYVLWVACLETAQRKQQWVGEWAFYMLSADGQRRKVIVTTRMSSAGGPDLRIQKTIGGVISFLHKFGYSAATVPFNQGEAFPQLHRGTPDPEAASAP
ncbi:hypothetical protein [Chachezhania sediminis]|uniref:hypothetical protein n=1 Tax=Chachezhania sediminis TaxID=2599291 RepID=UPI00131C8886|nr:hypothetical protein [Chachezhania sediminis]